MKSPFDAGDLLDTPELYPLFSERSGQPLTKRVDSLNPTMVDWMAANDLLHVFKNQKTAPYLQQPMYAKMFLESAIKKGYRPEDLGVDVAYNPHRITSLPFIASDGTRYPVNTSPSFLPGEALVKTIQGMESSAINNRFNQRRNAYQNYKNFALNTVGMEPLDRILADIDTLPVARGTIDTRWVTPLQADSRIPVLYEAVKSIDNRNIPKGSNPSIPPDIEGMTKNVRIYPQYTSSRIVSPQHIGKSRYSKVDDYGQLKLVYVGAGNGTVGKYNTHAFMPSEPPFARVGEPYKINASAGLLMEPDISPPTVRKVKEATSTTPALYINPFDPSSPDIKYLREALREGRANIQDPTNITPFTSRQPVALPYMDNGRLVIPPLIPNRSTTRLDGMQLRGVEPQEIVPILSPHKNVMPTRMSGYPSQETIDQLKQRNRGLTASNIYANQRFGDISWDNIVPAVLRRYEERWLKPRDMSRQVFPMDMMGESQRAKADALFTNRTYRMNKKIDARVQSLYDAILANKERAEALGLKVLPTQATPILIAHYDNLAEKHGAVRDESITYDGVKHPTSFGTEPLPIKKDLPLPAKFSKKGRIISYDYSDIPSGRQTPIPKTNPHYNRMAARFYP